MSVVKAWMVGRNRCGIWSRKALTVVFFGLVAPQNSDLTVFLAGRDDGGVVLAAFAHGDFVNANRTQIVNLVQLSKVCHAIVSSHKIDFL